MEVKTPIPTQVVVAGHPCTIFYRGQVRLCFRCSQTGHEAKNCPKKQSAPPGGSGQREEEHVPPPSEHATPNQEEGMSTEPPTSPRSFADVVASPGTNGSLSGELIPPTTISPFPKEVLTLPTGRIEDVHNEGECSRSRRSKKVPQSQNKPIVTMTVLH